MQLISSVVKMGLWNWDTAVLQFNSILIQFSTEFHYTHTNSNPILYGQVKNTSTAIFILCKPDSSSLNYEVFSAGTLWSSFLV